MRTLLLSNGLRHIKVVSHILFCYRAVSNERLMRLWPLICVQPTKSAYYMFFGSCVAVCWATNYWNSWNFNFVAKRTINPSFTLATAVGRAGAGARRRAIWDGRMDDCHTSNWPPWANTRNSSAHTTQECRVRKGGKFGFRAISTRSCSQLQKWILSPQIMYTEHGQAAISLLFVFFIR